MYLVFTRKPGESYRRRLRSLLLYLSYVFRTLINSLVCRLFSSLFFIYIHIYVKNTTKKEKLKRRKITIIIIITMIIIVFNAVNDIGQIRKKQK